MAGLLCRSISLRLNGGGGSDDDFDGVYDDWWEAHGAEASAMAQVVEKALCPCQRCVRHGICGRQLNSLLGDGSRCTLCWGFCDDEDEAKIAGAASSAAVAETLGACQRMSGAGQSDALAWLGARPGPLPAQELEAHDSVEETSDEEEVIEGIPSTVLPRL